jgi:hypothetical protein
MAAFKLTKAEATALKKLVEDYETAADALRNRLDEIASDWESEHGEKSERWQEGEAGQAAQEKIELVRGWFDEMPGEETPAIDPEALL